MVYLFYLILTCYEISPVVPTVSCCYSSVWHVVFYIIYFYLSLRRCYTWPVINWNGLRIFWCLLIWQDNYYISIRVNIPGNFQISIRLRESINNKSNCCIYVLNYKCLSILWFWTSLGTNIKIPNFKHWMSEHQTYIKLS